MFAEQFISQKIPWHKKIVEMSPKWEMLSAVMNWASLLQDQRHPARQKYFVCRNQCSEVAFTDITLCPGLQQGEHSLLAYESAQLLVCFGPWSSDLPPGFLPVLVPLSVTPPPYTGGRTPWRKPLLPLLIMSRAWELLQLWISWSEPSNLAFINPPSLLCSNLTWNHRASSLQEQCIGIKEMISFPNMQTLFLVLWLKYRQGLQ